MRRAAQILSTFPREHWLLAAMLWLLHAAIWSDLQDALARSMMLAHLGLFLLWQPIWRRDQRLDPASMVVFLVATVFFVAWLNWWLVFLWMLLLIGIIGGRVFVDRRERLAYLITLLILTVEFLIGCTSRMFAVPLGRELYALFDATLLGAPALLLLMPVRPLPEERRVDFLHGLTTALLIGILALGGLLVMYSTGEPYPVALLKTMLTIAAFLFAMSWLLIPHPGFSGLSQLWARYLLNIGTPFEQWLAGLSAAAREHEGAGAFLEAAVAQLLRLPWVRGAAWSAPTGGGDAGEAGPYATSYPMGDVTITVYTRRPAPTTLILHGKLLAQVIAYFYSAKVAQAALARQAHLKAIYETGARVTHDIKNLLQSLYTLSTALQVAEVGREAELQALLGRQLPSLSQRLELALNKLQSPEPAAVMTGSLRAWWGGLSARHAADEVQFQEDLAQDVQVPTELFDSVAENLLENARQKRLTKPDLRVTVELRQTGPGVRLSVTDSGEAVPARTAQALLREPVPSRNGLGVGLYQAARQAEELGYRLRLAENRAGRVRFELSGPAGASRPPVPPVSEPLTLS